MKTWLPRFVLVVLGLPLLGLILSGSRLSGESIKQPKRLVILSTTDVKGRTNPCG